MRFLFSSFEGGGHVPPAIAMATHMRARGHEVLFVADEANRTAATRAGLTFEPWSTAPSRTAGGRADAPLDDWKRRWPPAVVRSVCRAVMTGPADAYAVDTLRLLDSFMPDLVVTNELLFGVQRACEARKQAVAVLTANLWCFPTRPDVPPFGPGWRPAATPFEARREISAQDAEVSAPERRPASEALFGTDRICATLVQGSDGSMGQVSASRQRNQMD
jgi:hypothetical protein